MAYFANKITTIPLWNNEPVAAGGACTSDVIDLREIASQWRFGISYRVKPDGAAATAGTTSFTYLSSATRDGVFVPETSTSGTSLDSATGGTGLWEFKPFLTPFMKIKGDVGTSGDNLISAELHVQ